MKKIGSAFFARLRACALAGAAALIVMNPSQSFAQTETESSDLEIIYVYEVEEAIESEGFKPLITRTAGPWGKSKILDTPYSLNVMSSDLIKNAGVSSFDEIAKMSPVVQLKYPNASPRGTAFFNIRGFTLGHANGRLQDGIRRIYYGIPMEDKERVEVLSGMSGFLYGPAHAGGAVNFVTKRPTPKTFATLLVGFRDGFTPYGHLDFGGPIDSEGRYGYRINAAVRNGETAIRNQEQLSAVVSGAFDFHITENAVWRFAASHYVNKNDNAPSEWRVLPGATRPSAPDPKSELAIGSRDKRVQDDFSTEINWDINDIFTVRTGFLYSNMNILYRDYKVNTFYANGTFLSGYNVDFNHPETPVTQMGGYFYIDSSFSTGILDHNLTLGVNTDYLHLMMIEPPTVYISLPPTLTTTVILKQKTKNFNYIIGDEISIFDKWKILIGGSYSNYEVSDLINNRTNEKHRITPTFSLAYKPS